MQLSMLREQRYSIKQVILLLDSNSNSAEGGCVWLEKVQEPEKVPGAL